MKLASKAECSTSAVHISFLGSPEGRLLLAKVAHGELAYGTWEGVEPDLAPRHRGKLEVETGTGISFRRWLS